MKAASSAKADPGPLTGGACRTVTWSQDRVPCCEWFGDALADRVCPVDVYELPVRTSRTAHNGKDHAKRSNSSQDDPRNRARADPNRFHVERCGLEDNAGYVLKEEEDQPTAFCRRALPVRRSIWNNFSAGSG